MSFKNVQPRFHPCKPLTLKTLPSISHNHVRISTCLMPFGLLCVAFFLALWPNLTAKNLSVSKPQCQHISRMEPSSVYDDFGKKGCFSPLQASRSLLACHSHHCNIFCGSRASLLLKNLSDTSCSSVLRFYFLSDRRAKRSPVLHNNSAV